LYLSGGVARGFIGDFLLEVGDGAGEAREIVKLARGKAVMESIDVVDQELLRAVLVVSEVPDDVTIHDVLGSDAANRTLQRLADHDLAVDRQMLPFGLASDGDGIRDIGNAAGEHGLVVGWRSPSKHLRSFGFLITAFINFRASTVFLGINGDIAGFILFGTAKGPEQCAHCHAGIEFLRETKAAGMAGLVANLLGADAQIFPSIGTIRKTRVGPPVLVPVAGIRDVRIGKSKVAFGLWIVCRFVREIDFLAVLLLHFLVHMRHVNGLLLVGRGRREQHENIVPLLCRGLGSSFRGKVNKVNVVDDDVRVVFLSHCLQKVPSNQVSYAGTKWLHWSIFRVFCCAAAVSGNRKNGPEPTPAARAPLPVHLMKSLRDSPSCFFSAILLPSEKQMGPVKLTSRIEGACPNR